MKLVPTTCPLDCPDACGALAEVDEEGRLQRIVGNPQHSWSAGHLCGKTAIAHEMVNSPERLTVPLVRRDGELRPASWDEALDCIAEGLAGLRGEEILALNYAGNMGQVARGFPMRLMHHLGASTTDGGICDNTANAAYEAIYGRVIGPDLETAGEADLLLIWGCDARRTQQHLMPRARQVLKRGGQVVVLDIYETDTLRQIRSWGGLGIVLEPGGDAALAMELIVRAFREGAQDQAFLDAHCNGVQELREEALGTAADGSPDGSGPGAGRSTLGSSEASQAALLESGRGLDAAALRRHQHARGLRLAAVLGHADRLHFQSSDHFAMSDDVLRQPWRRPSPDPARTIRHVELGRELASGGFRAAFVWGHNPAVTCPTPAACAPAWPASSSSSWCTSCS